MRTTAQSDDLVIVRIYSYRHEAELAQSMLEAREVPSLIRADDAGGMGPQSGLTRGGVRLLVRPADAATADHLLG